MWRQVLLWIPCAAISACTGIPATGSRSLAQPADTYDYNFCGGVPLYPIIGFTFATYCGPSNQLMLGRTGKLMWLYPSAGEGSGYQGEHKLSEKQLKHLSLLAEAVLLTGKPEHKSAPVNYRIGIDFRGREVRQRFGVFSAVESPSNRLLRAMLDLAPDKPALPECGPDKPFFDPVQLPGERARLTAAELDKFEEHTHAAKK